MFKLKQLAGLALTSMLVIGASLKIPVQAAATGPSIDKSALMVWVSKAPYYFPKPGQREDARWSWSPNLDFKINGPIESGTAFVVEYWLKDKLWWSKTLTSEPQPAGNWYHYDRVGYDFPEEKVTQEIGPVGLTIRAVNELQGTNTWLYKGTFNIKKYNSLDPKKFPLFKDKFDYVVDQDWRMPFGFITGNWTASTYSASNLNETPTVSAHMWFRGDSTNLKTEAHLFYKGKDIAKAEGNQTSWGTADESGYLWSDVKFTFGGTMDRGPVFFYDLSQGDSYASAFKLNKNPGDYEVKVLHNGKLSRTMKFAVGTDGKIVDNGYSLHLAALDRWTMPVQIVSQTDGAWDANAWKTGAFYNNLIPGFKLN